MGRARDKAKGEKVAIIEDHKPPGNLGGGASVVGWNRRELNTVVHDDGIVMNLDTSTGTVTLGGGLYRIKCSAPAFDCFYHTIIIESSSGVLLYGSTEFARDAPDSNAATRSFCEGYIDLPETTDIGVNHHISVASGGQNGLGLPSGVSGNDSVYTQLKITKVK